MRYHSVTNPPAGALILFDEANVLLEKGEYKQAIRLYNQAIQKAPNFSLAYTMRRLAEKNARRPMTNKAKAESILSGVFLTALILLTSVVTYFSLTATP